MRRWTLLAILAVGGCSPYSIDEDYDPSTDFAKFKTWTWFTGPKPSGPSLDDLTEQRIRKAIEGGLPHVGLTKGADGSTDLLVAYHVSIAQRIDVTPTTVSFGYGWGRGYVGTSYGSEVRTYDEGTLLIDLLDAKTKSLVWRGTARATVYRNSTPEEREIRIREAVQLILQQYPPTR